MSCDRCVDIHNGQLCGCNPNPCNCECHNSYSTYCDVTCGTTPDLTFGVNTTVTTCDNGGCHVLNLNNS